MSTRLEPKHVLIEKVAELLHGKPGTRVLDLGCGQALNALPLLERVPDLVYVGVEPDPTSAERAAAHVARFRKARVECAFAYAPREDAGTFDICLSLSVLEHVKQLDLFLRRSVEAVRPGGTIVHWYDLGHALTPSSWREAVHVWLGNHAPGVLPEGRFVRHLPVDEVCRSLEAAGARIERVTRHQMPSHKAFLKAFATGTPETDTLARALVDWEYAASPHLDSIAPATRDRLFPSICVWARRPISPQSGSVAVGPDDRR